MTTGPGDRAITVSWAPGDLNGDTLVKYTATASPGGKSCTVNSNSNSSHDILCTIHGLTNGTVYTVTVTTSSSNGAAASSAPSPPVTPTAGLPPGVQPPVITNAEPHNEAITVSWQAGQQASATLLGYTITATATTTPCPATTTPCVIATRETQRATGYLATAAHSANCTLAACVTTPTGSQRGKGKHAAAANSATCTTTDATICTITGLTNGTSYLITATTHTTAGDSSSQPATTEPTPTPTLMPSRPAPTLPTTGTPVGVTTVTATACLMIILGVGLTVLGYRRRRRTGPTLRSH